MWCLANHSGGGMNNKQTNKQLPITRRRGRDRGSQGRAAERHPHRPRPRGVQAGRRRAVQARPRHGPREAPVVSPAKPAPLSVRLLACSFSPATPLLRPLQRGWPVHQEHGLWRSRRHHHHLCRGCEVGYFGKTGGGEGGGGGWEVAGVCASWPLLFAHPSTLSTPLPPPHCSVAGANLDTDVILVLVRNSCHQSISWCRLRPAL